MEESLAPPPLFDVSLSAADIHYITGALAGRPPTPAESERTVSLVGYLALAMQCPAPPVTMLPAKSKAKAVRKPRAAKPMYAAGQSANKPIVSLRDTSGDAGGSLA